MSNLSYKIQIDGIDRVITSTSEANKLIKDLTAKIIQAKEAGQDFTVMAVNLNKALDIRTNVMAVSRGLDPMVSSLNNTNRASSNAAAALLNLNYVVRDSPYFFNNFALGVMAIGNNINPLIDSFSRLRMEAGEKSISAFQLLKQALVGGAGISIAFSVAVSAIQAFVFWMAHAESQAKKTKDEVSDTTKALQSMLDVQTPAKSLVYKLTPDQLISLISKLDSEVKTLEADKKALDIGSQTIGSGATSVKINLESIKKDIEQRKKDNKDLTEELKKQKTELEAQLKVMQIMTGFGLNATERKEAKDKKEPKLKLASTSEKDLELSMLTPYQKEIFDKIKSNFEDLGATWDARAKAFAWNVAFNSPQMNLGMSPVKVPSKTGIEYINKDLQKETKDLKINLELSKIVANQLGDTLAQAFEKGRIKLNEFLQSLAVAVGKMLLLKAIMAIFTGGTSEVGGTSTVVSGGGVLNKVGSPSIGQGMVVNPTFVFENVVDGQKILYKGIKQTQSIQR